MIPSFGTCTVAALLGTAAPAPAERPPWQPKRSISAAYVSEFVRPGARLGFDTGVVGVERRRALHELFVGGSLGLYVFPRSYALAWAGGELGYRLVGRRHGMFELYTGLHGGVRPNWGTTYALAADGSLDRTTGVAGQLLPTFGWGAGQDFRRKTDGTAFGWFLRMYSMFRVPHNGTFAPLVMFELGIRLDPLARRRRSAAP